MAGRLPLFGASYSALILIPAYLYALEVYKKKLRPRGPGLKCRLFQVSLIIAARPTPTSKTCRPLTSEVSSLARLLHRCLSDLPLVVIRCDV